jgi:hypothetical protein
MHDPEIVSANSKGDIALFTFIMLYLETEQFRKGIHMDMSNLDSPLNAIVEIVKSIAPSLLILPFAEYKRCATSFSIKVGQH